MAATKQEVASYVKPDVVPVYKYTAEIDTTPSGQSRTWKALCAGFNNLSEALNETVQQYFFLCGKGHAVNYVTGMAPTDLLHKQDVPSIAPCLPSGGDAPPSA